MFLLGLAGCPSAAHPPSAPAAPAARTLHAGGRDENVLSCCTETSRHTNEAQFRPLLRLVGLDGISWARRVFTHPFFVHDALPALSHAAKSPLTLIGARRFAPGASYTNSQLSWSGWASFAVNERPRCLSRRCHNRIPRLSTLPQSRPRAKLHAYLQPPLHCHSASPLQCPLRCGPPWCCRRASKRTSV